MYQNGLSVCIITKNEEKMLPDCLKSISGIASEIIIVDTGSDDRTIQIAEGFGCRIYESIWENDFSKARNKALSYAIHPFILSIDADERVVNPEILLSTINKAQSNEGGWLIEIISNARRPGGGYDTYNTKLLRLFRNHTEIRFSGIIHEQIIEPIIKLGLKLVNSDIKINHLGYDFSPDEMTKKQLRNLELLNVAISKNPKDGYSYFQRAKTNLSLNKLEQAENDIIKALEYSNENGALKPQALNYGGIIAYQRNDYQTSKLRAEESLKLVPGQAFANFILGEALTSENRFADAYEAYRNLEKAIETPDIYSQIIGEYYVPPEHLFFRKGKCLLGLKFYENALGEFEEGLKINPNNVNCLVGAANVAFNIKKYTQSIELLKKALENEPENGEIKGFIKQVENAIGQTQGLNVQSMETIGNENDNIYNQINSVSGKDQIEQKQKLISLSMIVKNEEENIGECLKSVIDLVDEIIIVDTGSIDRTKGIAEKYGAKIFDFEWIDDFAAARNESLKHCTGEWILYLDADERLDESCRGNLRALLKSANDGIGGFICTLESLHVQLDGNKEKHRGGYPRIFRNYGYPRIHFKGRVHEQITPSIIELGKSIPFSDIIIQHLGYNQSREVMEGKIKRNYRMLIQHVQEEPLNGYAWYQLGQTLAQMQLVKEAEETIRFAIEAGNLSDSVYASATATLSQLTGNKKNFKEALFWAEKSLGKAAGQVYALHLKAYSLMYLERFNEAEAVFLEVLRKMKEKKGVPHAGFDIELDENIVLKGLEETRKRIGG